MRDLLTNRELDTLDRAAEWWHGYAWAAIIGLVFGVILLLAGR